VSRPNLLAAIKQNTTGAGSSRRGGWLRGALIGMQVALCMALMIGAGLLLRGLYTTYTVDPGFDYGDIAVVSIAHQEGYQGDAARLRQRLMDEVEALPGIDAVAAATLAPLGNDEFFTVSVRLPGEGEDAFRASRLNAVTPGFFSLLGIPLVRGRDFTEAEIGSGGTDARPAIVSERTVSNLWPGRDPIGQTLLLGDAPLRVIGVVADMQATAIGGVDPYYVYTAARSGQALLVKSRTDFGTTATSIRTMAGALDPTLSSVVRVFPLEENLAWWRGLSATVTTLGASLGVLALALASVGIYGVVSYSVTRRYREIGIRIALGATGRNVLAMVLRRTMRPVVIGATIGIAAAITTSGILSSVLFGVSPADPAGLGSGALLVVGVALTAGVLAARHAARIDPTVALRYE
jgi:predicted permease